jgi:hypothetical protein
MEIEEGVNSAHVERNIWVEYADDADAATRFMVQALTTAAYTIYLYPDAGYGP